jgi:peptidoglycan/xylan/chitin deacetylase (PgdA/CDA1 family)
VQEAEEGQEVEVQEAQEEEAIAGSIPCGRFGGGKRARRWLLGVLGTVACLGAAVPASAGTAETVVTLSFKDALISQYEARQALSDHGLDGTFYVNSGLIANRATDVQTRMSWRQISDLASDGNEIGGAGVSRQSLPPLADAALEAEICDDRAELAQRGYAPVSFGYPFAADSTPTVEAKVEQCGYASARGSSGIGGAGQPLAESVPPADPFNTRVRAISESHSLATIEGWVTAAEAQGGWLQLVIHSVCADPGCSITPANFESLADWLEDREGQGTTVETAREVMTGTGQPQPRPFLETTVSLNFDDGLDEHYTIARPVLAANGLLGTFYVNSGRVAEDNRFMTWNQVRALADSGQEIGGHAKEHESLVGLNEADLEEQICDDRDDLIDDADLSASQVPVNFAYPRGEHDQAAKDMVQQCGYISARWTEGLKWYTRHSRCQLLSCPFDEQIHPPDPYKIRVPGSFGTVDNDIERYKQTVRNVEDSGGGWLPLLFHEICPGPTPTESGCPDENSSTTPELFEEFVEWLAARDGQGTHVRTMKQVMQGAAQPRAAVDTTDPVSQVECDDDACSGGFYDHPVSVELSATDAGGSGVAEIRYETDGSVPTGSSPVYSGPIEVGQSATLRWRASDNHGNVEALRSQPIGVDLTPPSSTIACDGAPCSSSFYNHSVSVSLAAGDGAGSGVDEIRYTTDGTPPDGSSALYTAPFAVPESALVRFRATDELGHVESPGGSQQLSIDTQAPSTQIACDGEPCEGQQPSGVLATLEATDAGGSGLDAIRYTTNGSAPTGSSPAYSGPIPVNATTTIRFRAEDNAGNVETPQTATVQIRPALVPVGPGPPTATKPKCKKTKGKKTRGKLAKAKKRKRCKRRRKR